MGIILFFLGVSLFICQVGCGSTKSPPFELVGCWGFACKVSFAVPWLPLGCQDCKVLVEPVVEARTLTFLPDLVFCCLRGARVGPSTASRHQILLKDQSVGLFDGLYSGPAVPTPQAGQSCVPGHSQFG